MKTNRPKATTDVPGLLRITYHPNEEANVFADCLENQFTSHDLCDKNREREVGTRIQTLLGTPLRKVRPCDILN
jgi:hypothetical protein